MRAILALILLLILACSCNALRLPVLQRANKPALTLGNFQTAPRALPSLRASPAETNLKTLMSKKTLDCATNMFPFWVLGASVLGWVQPTMFLWMGPFVTPALALTMLSMGMTLTIGDFKRVATMPQWVLLGFLVQFTVMPVTAATMAKLWGLCPDLASGLILVGCAPGGTASNLVSLIAKADVALSVLMTMASTLAAIVMTPLLTAKLAGGYVEVKAAELVISTLQVVLGPVVAGLSINTVAPVFTKKAGEFTPFLSVMLVSAICGCISAANSGTALKSIGVKLIGAILSLHSIGFGLGYYISKMAGSGETRARTIAIETGMQNSALAVVLAKHFPNPALSSLPGALSATVHSVIGSILAAYWRKTSSNQDTKKGYAVSARYW